MCAGLIGYIVGFVGVSLAVFEVEWKIVLLCGVAGGLIEAYTKNIDNFVCSIFTYILYSTLNR